MSNSYTIAETFTLPSKGLIYDTKVNPQVRLRSMTTVEEMRRLSHTDTPYKTLCDIIDSCIVDPIGISSYDMHLGDYQFLLHKLRVVTYGPEYPSSSICPVCGKTNRITLNLDDIEVFSFDEEDEEYKELFNLTLPKTGKRIVLKFQTPRDLDLASQEEKEFNTSHPDNDVNISYLITLKHLVKTVDGEVLKPMALDQFLRKLPLMDSNAILQRATKINNKVGINTAIQNICTNPKCGAKYRTTFRITNEFFGPTID